MSKKRRTGGTRTDQERIANVRHIQCSRGVAEHGASFLALPRFAARHRAQELLSALLAAGMERRDATERLRQLTGQDLRLRVVVGTGAPLEVSTEWPVSPTRTIRLSVKARVQSLTVDAVTVTEITQAGRWTLDPTYFEFERAGQRVTVIWRFRRGRSFQITGTRVGNNSWQLACSRPYGAGERIDLTGGLLVQPSCRVPLVQRARDGGFAVGNDAAASEDGVQLFDPKEMIARDDLRDGFRELAAGLTREGLPLTSLGTGNPNPRLPK